MNKFRQSSPPVIVSNISSRKLCTGHVKEYYFSVYIRRIITCFFFSVFLLLFIRPRSPVSRNHLFNRGAQLKSNSIHSLLKVIKKRTVCIFIFNGQVRVCVSYSGKKRKEKKNSRFMCIITFRTVLYTSII